MGDPYECLQIGFKTSTGKTYNLHIFDWLSLNHPNEKIILYNENWTSVIWSI